MTWLHPAVGASCWPGDLLGRGGGTQDLGFPLLGREMTGELTRMKLTSGQGQSEARISDGKKEGRESWPEGGSERRRFQR